MAKKVTTWLTDDIEADKGNTVAADQTVEFGVDGHRYEIDLSSKNAMKLRADIEQWAKHARRLGRVRKIKVNPSVSVQPTRDGMDAIQRRAARGWLRANGWPDLPDRGRIPQEALDAYHSRHPQAS